ncbi:MAG TPA: hypothetical protein GX525_03815 [Bacilli bacterium]|nr:hypothetical protein [Bacilli bacterium]
MKQKKFAKWVVGISAVTFSSFLISQLDNPEQAKGNTNNEEWAQVEPISFTEQKSQKLMNVSDREQFLASLDWESFEMKETTIDSFIDTTTMRS